MTKATQNMTLRCLYAARAIKTLLLVCLVSLSPWLSAADSSTVTAVETTIETTIETAKSTATSITESAEAPLAEAVITQPDHKTLVIGLPHLRGADISFHHVSDFFLDFWRWWGARHNYTIRFKKISQSQVNSALQNGEIDILSFGFHNTQLTDNHYFSLPILKFRAKVFRRAGDSFHTPSLFVHLPRSAELFETYFDFDVQQSVAIKESLGGKKQYDFIYSWAPWIMQEQLFELGLSSLYQEVEDGVPPVYLRAMVAKRNKALMLQINQSFRDIEPKLVKDMWLKFSDLQQLEIDVMIGDYLKQVTTAQQHYLLDNPVVYFNFIDDDFGPYHFRNHFNTSGYTQDIIDEVTDRTGLIFQPKVYQNFYQAQAGQANNEFQIMPNISETSDLENQFLFSQSYHQTTTAIISQIHQDLHKISDLNNRTVALVRGHSTNQLLDHQKQKIQISYFDSVPEALQAVASGSADAYLGESANAAFVIQQYALNNLVQYRISEQNHSPEFRFRLNKSQTVLVEILNLGLNSLSIGQQQQINQRWFAKAEDSHSVEQLQTWILYFLFCAIFLISTTYGLYRYKMNRKLKEQAKVQKQLVEAQALRRQAETSARAKSDFLARMSHEIRTPMNGVLGIAEALSFTSLNNEQKDLLDVLTGSAQNLMALLNDVLDFSKMDADKLTVEQFPFSPHSVVNNVIQNFKHQARSSGIELSASLDNQLAGGYLGDPTRLTQIINNLVSNAIKFTKAGYVKVKLDLLDDEYQNQLGQHLIRIEVRDSGIGIPKNKLDTLFNPFVQADDDITRRFGGTGLGLSICKEITQAMNGHIDVTSMDGIGSQFIITIPLQIAQHEAELAEDNPYFQAGNSARASHSQISQLKVLLAEDNPVNRRVIHGQLSRLGFDVDMAENGLIAYNMHLKNQYDIVISDCHMPEMDGFTLAKKILSERQNESPRLIALTADALSGAEQTCLSVGFDAYIAKPCPIETLQQKLAHEIDFLSQHTQVDSESAKSEPANSDQPNTAHVDSGHVKVEPPEAPLNDDELLSSFALDFMNESIDLPSTTTDSAEISAASAAQIHSASKKLDSNDKLQPTSQACHSLVTGKHLNIDQVKAFSGDDSDIIRDVLTLFLTSSTEDFNQLSAAVTDADWSEAKQLVHKIKSGVRYLGATELGDFAQQLEHQLIQDQSEHTLEQVALFLAEHQRLSQEVSNYLNQLAAPTEVTHHD